MGVEGNANYEPFPVFTSWYPGGFDSAGFDRYRQLLEQSRAAATPEALLAASTAAARYAAVDTNAIEGIYSVDRGFTRTVATQAAAWESAMESRGQHARAAFEDAIGAYEYVLDAATRSTEVTELWIRELHQIVCASQTMFTVFTPLGPQEQPLPKGVYKTMPNSPTRPDGVVHAYASPMDTPAEMHRLVQELRSEAFQAAHPVLQAAYAHYAYVSIHPFADGNGRVARALASVYLYRDPGVPLVIFADQRNEYFDALESSDRGESGPFVEFVGTRTVDAIGILRSMLSGSASSLENSLAGLRRIFSSPVDNDEVLLAAGARLRTLAVAELAKQIGQMALPKHLEFRANAGKVGGSIEPPLGYSGFGRDGCLYMLARSSWPRTVRQLATMEVFVTQTATDLAPEFMLSNGRDGDLDVWLRELDPVATETLGLKLSAWLESRISELLSALLAQVEPPTP